MAARPDPADAAPVRGRPRASLHDCRVVESRALGAYRLLSFVSEPLARTALAGQFLMIRRSGPSLDPLIPRPIGVSDVRDDLVDVLIEPRGKGTLTLAGARVGDTLRALGPLGNGFDMEGKGGAVVVGGGIGVAPLKFLARSLRERGREPLCVLGFRERSQAAAAELFSGFEVDLLTEDGSAGRQGLVSDPLPGCLTAASGEPGPPEVFACGPKPMLIAVEKVCRECGSALQVSVDSHMACGVGACQGCVVEAAGGYAKVCSDGPVFRSGELAWTR
ncbi:MAG: dihydroorotate dehydrogenase electron transfer subunit [Pseudomonadota bacterium]